MRGDKHKDKQADKQTNTHINTMTWLGVRAGPSENVRFLCIMLFANKVLQNTQIFWLLNKVSKG